MEKVLLIGGDEGLRKYLKHMEAREELELHVVETGYDALEAVETLHPAIAFTPSSIDGLDGIQLLGHLKEVDPDLEVIFMTGSHERDTHIDALEMGACDSVAGPLDEKMLLILLRRACQKLWMRRRLSEALEEIQKRHDFEFKLIHTSMDGIIANDRQGNIILFNEGASRIYGFTPEEAVAEIHVTRLYPEGKAREIKKKIYGPDYGGAGRLINYETWALTKEKRLVPILLSATLIYEREVEVATVGYFKDLSGIKRST
ncbi:MAG: response regulator [Desulforhabdus sp.]|jgi:PAS domain S-box-containing protein|nr:response regulator [Desulforhabdus sp.]